MTIELIMVKKLRILNPHLVLTSAKEIGRINGRGNDWTPESLSEAVEELDLIGDGSPIDNGYEVISTVIQ
jgi:hypothetical protein